MGVHAVALGHGGETATQGVQSGAGLRLEGAAQEETAVLLIVELGALDNIAAVGHQEGGHVGDDADAVRAGQGQDKGGRLGAGLALVGLRAGENV